MPWLFGALITLAATAALLALAMTELIGAIVPGFLTISDATRMDIERGDYRLFVAVLILILGAGIWWPIHILFRI